MQRAHARAGAVGCLASLRPVFALPCTPLPPRRSQVWDLKTGYLSRIMTGHNGLITAITFAQSARLLFSTSVDGNIGVWTEKGNLLQVTHSGEDGSVAGWSAPAGCHGRRVVPQGHSTL